MVSGYYVIGIPTSTLFNTVECEDHSLKTHQDCVIFNAPMKDRCVKMPASIVI